MTTLLMLRKTTCWFALDHDQTVDIKNDHWAFQFWPIHPPFIRSGRFGRLPMHRLTLLFQVIQKNPCIITCDNICEHVPFQSKCTSSCPFVRNWGYIGALSHMLLSYLFHHAQFTLLFFVSVQYVDDLLNAKMSVILPKSINFLTCSFSSCSYRSDLF